MKKRLMEAFKLVKSAIKKYQKDDPVRLAGTTAYFTVFAMAPIIIIIISITGILLGETTIQHKVYNELQNLVGNQGTEYIKNLVANYQDTQKNIIGTIVGFGIFIFTSTTFFTVLQRSLNYIWRIKAKPKHNILRSLYDRLISFGLILSLGFVMLVSLLIDAAISFLKDFITNSFPGLEIDVLQFVNFFISFGILIVIFAVIYKFLPDAHIKWRVTWVGAIVTTVLFMAGKFVIGLALGKSNIGVMYGAAGSLVVILLWVFYSSLIFFFGAEITHEYARMYSHEIKPKDYAVAIEINEVKPKESPEIN